VRAGWAWPAVGLLAVLGAAVSVSALPVPVGRHVEVPFGISAAHPWATEAGDAQRSGRGRYPAPREAPGLLWEQRVGVGSAASPAVTEAGVLYAVTSAGVASLDDAGEVRWSRRVRFARGVASLLPGGRIVMVTRGGRILRLSDDGRTVGDAHAGAGVGASPLVLPDGSLVVVTRDRAIARIAADGRPRFRVSLPHMPLRPVAWDGGDRLVVAAGSELRVLSTDGRLRTQATLPGSIVAGPLVAGDGTVWVATAEGQLAAFGPEGRSRARAEVGVLTSGDGMALGPGGAVRVATREHGLVCMGPSGTERWRLDSEGTFLGGLTVDPHGVTLGVTAQGVLVAVAPDGTVRWRVPTHPRTASHPVIHRDGTIFLGTSAGTVQALR
jgi:outer membrane protein assembly factor BamB